jgi:hypothetical protein
MRCRDTPSALAAGGILAELLLGREHTGSGPNTLTASSAHGPVASDEATVRQALLELSHAMVNPDHHKRPPARQVERDCARIAREAPGESLRDWAEEGCGTR